MAVIDAGPSTLDLLRATLDAVELWREWWEHRPFVGDCPRCGRMVTVVWLFGEDVALEVVEVLPRMRCSRCASNVAQGHLGTDPRATGCWRCGGSGLVGQELPSVGVAIAEDGSARPFTGHLFRGEGLQVFHVCS